MYIPLAMESAMPCSGASLNFVEVGGSWVFAHSFTFSLNRQRPSGSSSVPYCLRFCLKLDRVGVFFRSCAGIGGVLSGGSYDPSPPIRFSVKKQIYERFPVNDFPGLNHFMKVTCRIILQQN